jgi:hypothetical protein
MARKRDHKAEYAARKAKAQKAGYSSVYEARKARKVLQLPRTRHTPPKRVVQRYNPSLMSTFETGMSKLRREAAKWSNSHSRSDRSKYRDDMTNAEVRAYYRAYVEKPKGFSRRKGAREKRRRIGEYIMNYYDVSEAEWSQKYELMPVG